MSSSADDRRAARRDYKQTRKPAGVYRLVNRQTGKALLASSLDLPGIRNRIDFARSTRSVGAFDQRLREDLEQYGVAAFEFEVLDQLEIKDDATDDSIREDLAALESLWREKLVAAQLY